MLKFNTLSFGYFQCHELHPRFKRGLGDDIKDVRVAKASGARKAALRERGCCVSLYRETRCVHWGHRVRPNKRHGRVPVSFCVLPARKLGDVKHAQKKRTHEETS